MTPAIVRKHRTICVSLIALSAVCIVGSAADPAFAGAAPRASARQAAAVASMPVAASALTFEDNFEGNRVDSTRWRTDRNGWTMNGVTVNPANAQVANGMLSLTLASAQSGISVESRYGLPVGGVAEARIRFAGNGSMLYNWGGFWACDWGGQGRAGGENDIAEVLGGQISSAYHAPGIDINYGTQTKAYLGGQWHTWSLHRLRFLSQVYLDGTLVKSWPTLDNGSPEPLIFTQGASPYTSRNVFGAASRMDIDYLRVWATGA